MILSNKKAWREMLQNLPWVSCPDAKCPYAINVAHNAQDRNYIAITAVIAIIPYILRDCPSFSH